jgi:hypothetical protein
MSTTIRLLGAWVLVALATGCVDSTFEIRAEKELDRLRAENAALLQRMKKLESQVNDGLTLALCTHELRQLLEDVNKECASGSESGGAMCFTKQINPAVISADPEHRGRFLKLMSHLPHEVVYLDLNATEIVSYRMERLERLLRPALLRSTVFLVVSSPEAGEAEALRRAHLVEGILRDSKIPPAIIRRWIYKFPANKNDIVRQSDQPGLVETKDLHRGVWVFRADC